MYKSKSYSNIHTIHDIYLNQDKNKDNNIFNNKLNTLNKSKSYSNIFTINDMKKKYNNYIENNNSLSNVRNIKNYSYSEFMIRNKNANKSNRQNAVKLFYTYLSSKL